METVIDTDVHNMARWGILFQDATETFTGSYHPAHCDQKGNVWNYIDVFGLTDPKAIKPEHRYAGGDTPVFWNVWNESTLSGPTYDWWAYRNDRHGELLEDWERDLLGWNEHIGWQVLKNGNYVYNSDIWTILAGD